MPARSRDIAACLSLAAALACAGDPAGPKDDPAGDAPSLASPNGAVGVVVGTALNYDATKAGATFAAPAGAALAYSISFPGASGGLSAEGGTVTGQPAVPGVTWATIVATDQRGRSASDRFAIVAFAAGLPTPALPPTPFAYSDAALPPPAHFRTVVNGGSAAETDNAPAGNPITDAGAGLGRVLFYDRRLSANDQLACAGCHHPSVGFSDSPASSVGFAGVPTLRHSPGLANARFYRRGRFFWDERAATLEDQVLQPIQDRNELGLTLEDLAAKLAATPYYPPLFAAAFGSPEVTSERVSRALAQFVRSLVSTDSRYDRAFAADGTPSFAGVFTPQELEGEQLFRSAGCADCHQTAAQVSDSIHNVGLDPVTTDTGAGRGAFKAPSLRNVAVRPRFMHDGRFTTLEQVIDFFDAGVQPNSDLDPRLRAADGSPRRLGLTGAQKAALAAFLRTLTDSTFLAAPRFADPFATTPPSPPPGPPPTATVIMVANAYRPAKLTVAPGTVVTWTNQDGVRHSATFASPLAGTTPIFNLGSQQLTMPTVPGRYPYQCLVHGSAMRGTIVVR
jgi:cytochrome c peroxidase